MDNNRQSAVTIDMCMHTSTNEGKGAAEETGRATQGKLSDERDRMIYAEDTYTTVNAWGNARPVIGDMNTIRAHNKTILIENTGALNIAELEIVGSLDNGVTYDVPLFYGTLAKSTLIIVTED